MDIAEQILKLSGVPLSGSPAEQFMEKLDAITERSPLDHYEYILHDCRIHCSPTEGNSAIRINDIQSMRKGAGTEAMNTLCDLADECGVVLTLTAKGFSANPTPTKKLVEWYGRFRFITGMGNLKDGYRMRREPMKTIKLRGFKRVH